MTDNQQTVSQQSQQQQQQPPPTSTGTQQQVQRQMSQQANQNQQQVSQAQPLPIQPQPQQSIQPQPAQPQNIQSQQQQQQQQQQNVQQQQQSIQQLPQLQQIAPQQQQHLLPNLQNMTSVPISMTMAANPMNGNMTSNNLRPQLNQIPQVQVIHQAMHSPSFMPQFTYNQQLMLQNMQNMQAMQANVVSMNPQQLNMANMVAMQNRNNTNIFTPASAVQTPTTPTTPNIMNMTSGSSTQMTSSTTASTNAVKPTISNVNKQHQSQQSQQTQQQQNQQQQQQNIQQQGQGQLQPQQQQQQIHTLGQATAMIGGKPIILGQPGSLIQGQIGVISAGQLQTSQAYATGPTFGQIQSKQGQQISMTTNQGQGQVQMNSSQNSIQRFSQPQLIVSNAGGNAQLISTQPVFTNQMLQAMASQLQHYPQQPIMSAQGQAIISGQGLYIRSANPIQTPGIVTGVQNAMNSNFKNPNQQAIQTVAVPIQKQTTAAQTGKVLLPSVSKPATAKVPPNSMSSTAKTGTQTVMKTKGRPKGSGKSSPAVTSAAGNQVKSESLQSSTCKSPPPTNTVTALGSPDLSKNQSDVELERKSTNEDTPSEEMETSAGNEKVSSKSDEIVIKEIAIVESENKPMIISDPPVEKQRAIVKPHILTHVIEGFVIQEGPEPFPVQRSSLLTEFIPPKPGQPVEQSSLISMDEDEIGNDTETSHDEQGPLSGQQSSQCEYCNEVYISSNSARRFCSKSCAKRYNVGCTKRLHQFPGRPKDKGIRGIKRKRKGKKGFHGNRLQSSSSLVGVDGDIEEQSSSVSQEDTHSPSTSPDHRLHTPPPELQIETGEYIQPITSPTKWNVTDVYEFIKNLPGCSIYAEEFKSQEIDGQALLLLKEDHLMTTMNMKLGPALKICARINAIKEETG